MFALLGLAGDEIDHLLLFPELILQIGNAYLVNLDSILH